MKTRKSMGRRPISLLAGMFMALSFCLLFSEERASSTASTSQGEKAMKLRVFEGFKEQSAAAAQAVTSSYLKYKLWASIQSGDDLEAEQNQIKSTFNLTDVKLLTESSLEWGKGGDKKAHHLFRLNGNVYGILLASKDSLRREFRIEVYEQKDKGKANLLETEFSIPKKNIAIFGFEDSLGKPYFLSLREEAVAAASAANELFKPPKLIKKVDPVYPEEARKAGKEGIVVLSAQADNFGHVEAVKVLKSVDPLLDEAAIAALKQWIYEPALVKGKQQAVEFTVTMRFSLDKKKAGVSEGVAGGIAGGVQEGVRGGVEGGVEGGVAGGVAGGVEGGVAGGVESEELVKRRQEMEKDAVRCTGDIKPPKPIKIVNPVYPEIARQSRVEGVVILEIKADTSGRVVGALVLRSIPLLNQAAIDAVKQWVYEPLVIEGKPRNALFTVTVNFKLDEKDIDKFAEGAVKVRGELKPPKLIKIVEPAYPEIARQASIKGVVILQARTDIEGRVKDVMILRSIPLLNQAAIDAVKQWVYEPMIVDGVPKEAVFTVTVRFEPDKEEKSKAATKAKAAQAPEPGTVRASGEINPPQVLKKVEPVYPEEARKAGVEGVVILEAMTDAKGNVVRVKVLQSVPELDQAAIDALKQWKYEPFILNGKPVGVVFTVTVRFSLK